MLRTYAIFLYGMFDDMEDIEYFCLSVIGDHKMVSSVKYLVENGKNLIILVETETETNKFVESLHKILVVPEVKFYFIFDIQDVAAAHLPQKVKDFIFNKIEDQYLRIEYQKQPISMDMDEILEKINKDGINSLSTEEKNFLDNFED
jgi:hypothetical protein